MSTVAFVALHEKSTELYETLWQSLDFNGFLTLIMNAIYSSTVSEIYL